MDDTKLKVVPLSITVNGGTAVTPNKATDAVALMGAACAAALNKHAAAIATTDFLTMTSLMAMRSTQPSCATVFFHGQPGDGRLGSKKNANVENLKKISCLQTICCVHLIDMGFIPGPMSKNPTRLKSEFLLITLQQVADTTQNTISVIPA